MIYLIPILIPACFLIGVIFMGSRCVKQVTTALEEATRWRKEYDRLQRAYWIALEQIPVTTTDGKPPICAYTLIGQPASDKANMTTGKTS